MAADPVVIPQAAKIFMSAPEVPLYCILEPVLFNDH